MAEPKVRFKKDDGSSYPAWRTIPMSEVFTEISEKNRPELPVLSVQQGVGTVLRDSSDRNIMYDKSNLKNYKAIKKDDYIIHLRSFEGGLECSNYDGISSPAYRILRPQEILSAAYRDYFRSYEFIHNKLAVSVVGIRDGKNIDMDTFWQIPVPVACFEEQEKIADFLSSVDDVITASEEEVANLETQKKAVMKKIFSQEVRFKRNDGTDFSDWEEKALGSFAKRVTRKNKDNGCKLPLTISAEYGLIDQSEFFNKTVASKDMSTYYLLQNGEFAFNKSTSKDYPVGAIKRLDRYDVGAVSPLYICFELYGGTVLSDFAVQYFETDCWHQGVLDIAQEGARTHGLLNISVPGCFETIHELPSDLEEQQLIADFLSDFDEAIAAAKKELELWKELKKGLLQQMFV